jgi:single-stranded-DNA-specific exonuclease
MEDRGSRLHTISKIWHLRPHDAAAIEQLAQVLQVSPIVAQLLQNRGIDNPGAAHRFLTMPYKGLHEPCLLAGVPEAADRLHAATQARKKICVYGDYDVDGLTGTAILLQALEYSGADVQFYVPHRLDEGYGLNLEALAGLARSGVSTVVTVDCGIASLQEAESARQLGLELIVTDHHEFKDSLPRADVVVHPRLPGANYPFGQLSGSGVAFKLAWALCQRASGAQRVTPRLREFLLDSVALAGLGMIADWVPLLDENRIIVRHGLARLEQTSSIGLRALLESAGLEAKRPLTTMDVSFNLAPRLNAAGRLGCARLVVELLTTASPDRARALARNLDGQNGQRQQIERKILQEARELALGLDLEQTPALVLARKDWHAGVIGIVAGRLVEQFSRPALMIALKEGDEPGLGSGRSVPGFALHKALSACGENLISHGGHAAAAGFKIRHGDVDIFRQRFVAYAAEHFPTGPVAGRLDIDAEVPLSAVTHGLLEGMARLEPYGAGNPRPRLLAGPVQIVGSPRRVGKGERHLQFRVRQHEATLPAIAFGFAERAEELVSAGGQCCLVFTPTFNEWQGYRSVQLQIEDFQAGERARLA